MLTCDTGARGGSEKGPGTAGTECSAGAREADLVRVEGLGVHALGWGWNAMWVWGIIGCGMLMNSLLSWNATISAILTCILDWSSSLCCPS